MYNHIYLPQVSEFINEVSQLSIDTEYSKLILFEPKYIEMYSEADHNSYLPYFQSEYNTIYSVSPLISKSSDLLGNKRIRQLTPPTTEKISVSPFTTRNSSSFMINKNSTAFKDLSQVFTKK
jgi:hypothetical protein